MKLQYTITDENFKDFLLYFNGGQANLPLKTVEAGAAWLLGIQMVITFLGPFINRLGLRVYDIRNITMVLFLIIAFLAVRFKGDDNGMTLLRRAKAEGMMPEGLIGSHQLWFFQDGFRHHFGPFRREKSYSAITDIIEHRYTIYVVLLGDHVLIPYSAFASAEEKEAFLRFLGEKRRLYKGKGFSIAEKARENPERPMEYYQYHLSPAEALKCLADCNRTLGRRRMVQSPKRLFYHILSFWGIITMVFIPQIRTSSMPQDIWSGELVMLVLLLILNIYSLWLFTPWVYSGMERTLDGGGVNECHAKPQGLAVRKEGLYWYQETTVTAVSRKDIVDIKATSKTVCILLRDGFIYLPRGLFPTVEKYLAFKSNLLGVREYGRDAG